MGPYGAHADLVADDSERLRVLRRHVRAARARLVPGQQREVLRADHPVPDPGEGVAAAAASTVTVTGEGWCRRPWRSREPPRRGSRLRRRTRWRPCRSSPGPVRRGCRRTGVGHGQHIAAEVVERQIGAVGGVGAVYEIAERARDRLPGQQHMSGAVLGGQPAGGREFPDAGEPLVAGLPDPGLPVGTSDGLLGHVGTNLFVDGCAAMARWRWSRGTRREDRRVEEGVATSGRWSRGPG